MSQLECGPLKKILTFNLGNHNLALRKAGFLTFVVTREKDFTNPMIIDTSRLFILRTDDPMSEKIIHLIKNLRDSWPLIDVLIVSAKASPVFVLEAMNAGAKDIILSDDTDKIIAAADRIINNQKILPRLPHANSRKGNSFKFEGMISRSIQMWDIFETIKQAADSDANVLILGETGTGKELVARAVHRNSKRKGRFVAINCSAVPENLIDSELFGHVKGAFTGADRDKKGLFRYADDGTIFLDEIANMPLTAQYHLLRVLQENKIRPVGAHEEISVNARIIAATSQPLEDFVKQNKFREDLLYRLDVIRLSVPALKDRPEDIVFLFHHFSKKFSKSYELQPLDFSDRFLDAISNFEWPGNVRQLQNIAERLVLTLPGQRVMAKHFQKIVNQPKNTGKKGNSNGPDKVMSPVGSYENDVSQKFESLERDYFVSLLRSTNGKISEAAKVAEMSRRNLLRKLTKYGINKKEPT